MISMPKSYWKQAPKGFFKWKEEDQQEWLDCYRKMQRDRMREYLRRKKAEDPEFVEKRRDYQRQYRKQNREKINTYQQEYRTQKWVEALQAKADAQPES